MNRMFPVLLLGCVVLGLACQKHDEKANAGEPTPSVVQFKPTADSLLTAPEITAWVTCNTLLDSLCIVYQDSFKTDNPDIMYRVQNTFRLAQDVLCRQAGLGGGLEHYLWVTRAIGLPINATMRETFKIQLP